MVLVVAVARLQPIDDRGGSGGGLSRDEDWHSMQVRHKGSIAKLAQFRNLHPALQP